MKKEVLPRITGKMPNDIIFQVGQIGMINLDESVLRPIPTEYVIQHLIASYRFAEYEKYLSDRNVGIVGRETLSSGLEVVVLFVKNKHSLDEMEKVMAKMGWIRSSEINNLEGYPELVGAQFEKKKDFDAIVNLP